MSNMIPESEAKEREVIQSGYREGTRMVGKSTPATRRIMVGIPMTGTLRSEWVMARYGQVIPCNWSQLDAIQWIDQSSPIDFMVADARNIIVQQCLQNEYEWLFFIDHDVLLPPDTILKMNERMIDGKVPVWSGLYFTKSRPSEPLAYRGRGTGYYGDWYFGDEVWVDGIPMGCTMIHSSILRAMYDESEEYQVAAGFTVRKVFETPARVWWDPESRYWWTMTGTEDLVWCDRIMDEGIFKKAGWPEYQEMEFPFLIDTTVYCRHIEFDGVQYPAEGEEMDFVKPPKEEGDESEEVDGQGNIDLGVSVADGVRTSADS
ncbi:MAG: hypothetical protein ACXAEN_22330 [Candidatus Thorarchaeota archaeon]